MLYDDCLDGKYVKVIIYSGIDQFEADKIYNLLKKTKDSKEHVEIRLLDHLKVEVEIEEVNIVSKEDFLRDQVMYSVELKAVVVGKGEKDA